MNSKVTAASDAINGFSKRKGGDHDHLHSLAVEKRLKEGQNSPGECYGNDDGACQGDIIVENIYAQQTSAYTTDIRQLYRAARYGPVTLDFAYATIQHETMDVPTPALRRTSSHDFLQNAMEFHDFPGSPEHVRRTVDGRGRQLMQASKEQSCCRLPWCQCMPASKASSSVSGKKRSCPSA